jgi:hypothetical protein
LCFVFLCFYSFLQRPMHRTTCNCIVGGIFMSFLVGVAKYSRTVLVPVTRKKRRNGNDCEVIIYILLSSSVIVVASWLHGIHSPHRNVPLGTFSTERVSSVCAIQYDLKMGSQSQDEPKMGTHSSSILKLSQ